MARNDLGPLNALFRTDRRRLPDRRINFGDERFPLRDRNGIVVKSDRRKVPERRLGGYEITILK